MIKLQAHKNIRKVIVIDLTQEGDPIYAGISAGDLIASSPTLTKQMIAYKGEGHFYYAHVVADSHGRWAELARRIYSEGVR